MIIMDIFLVSFSLWLAFTLRFSEWFWPSQSQIGLFILALILAIPIFIKFDFYLVVVRYIGQKAMLAILQATGVLVLLWLLASITILPLYLDIELKTFIANWFPRSNPVLFGMTLLMAVGGSRLVARWILLKSTIAPAEPTNQTKKNVLIYGAGRVGLELASSLSHNKSINILGISYRCAIVAVATGGST